MKHLKLVINNKNIKRDIFFNKKELKLILNLYAEMVSGGEWKDYGLSISKKEVSFNVYHRASEFPAYKITKNLKPSNKNEKYLIKDAKNKIIKIEEITKQKLKDQIQKRQVLALAKIDQLKRDANHEIQQNITSTAIEATINLLQKKLDLNEKKNLINVSINELNSVLKN